MTEPQSPSPQQLYHDIMEYIKDARELTERGQFVELSALDARVQALCEATQQMQVQDAQQFKPQLDEMMQELSNLQQMFIERRDGLGEELGELGRRRQAAMAYKQNEASNYRHQSGAGDDEE